MLWLKLSHSLPTGIIKCHKNVIMHTEWSAGSHSSLHCLAKSWYGSDKTGYYNCCTVLHPVIVTMIISIKGRQTQLQYYILFYGGWLHVSASKRPSSGHPSVNRSIESKPYEMPAHYGIPCGFTRIVMDKNK
jgi:hypothetical protein